MFPVFAYVLAFLVAAFSFTKIALPSLNLNRILGTSENPSATTSASIQPSSTPSAGISYKFNLLVSLTTVKGNPLKLVGVKVTIDLTDEAKATLRSEGLPIPQFTPQSTDGNGETLFSAIPRRKYNVTISEIPLGYKLYSTEKNPQYFGSPDLSTGINQSVVTFKIARDNAKPNIVVIMTDDQRWDALNFMPTVQNELVSKGINFTNSYTVSPLCCPSRSSFLTGLYAHNHGVRTNTVPDGGATKFNDSSTIATWLHSAGYKTSLVGKYLNEYYKLNNKIPPGWDDWHAFESPLYYNYQLNENGKVNNFGSSPQDYSTDVLRDRAVSFIKNQDTTPFFLVFTPFAPHSGPTFEIPPDVAPRHKGSCDNLPNFRPPSFNETDISDKPKWVQKFPLMDAAKITYLDYFRKQQICTLKAVDEAVAAVIDALGPEIDNTMIVFTSDNGYLWGEHRLIGKDCEFEECIRVPLVIRYPKLTNTPRTVDSFVLNIDLAVTFTELAKTTPTTKVNGKSLVPILTNSASSVRDDFLAEYGLSNYILRNGQYTYVELLGTNEKELYDNKKDPFQLVNLLFANSSTYTNLVQTLSARLKQLRGE